MFYNAPPPSSYSTREVQQKASASTGLVLQYWCWQWLCSRAAATTRTALPKGFTLTQVPAQGTQESAASVPCATEEQLSHRKAPSSGCTLPWGLHQATRAPAKSTAKCYSAVVSCWHLWDWGWQVLTEVVTAAFRSRTSRYAARELLLWST